MAPPGKGGGTPGGKIADQINKDFGNFLAFQKEFTQAAKTCEGNGWAILAYDALSNSLFVMQVEKHNIATIAGLKPLLVLDVWEHSWVYDYPGDRPKYVENWWNLVNWNDVEKKFQQMD
jgi:Fe-Mn family superoxide dismutase